MPAPYVPNARCRAGQARGEPLLELLPYPAEPARRALSLGAQLDPPGALLSADAAVDPPQVRQIQDRRQRPLRHAVHPRNQLLAQRIDPGGFPRSLDSGQELPLARVVAVIIQQLGKQPWLPRRQRVDCRHTVAPELKRVLALRRVD